MKKTKGNIVRFCTAKELDPITAQCLDTRFTAFLSTLSTDIGMPFEEILNRSRAIMANAGITQDTLQHNLEDVDKQTMKSFNI